MRECARLRLFPPAMDRPLGPRQPDKRFAAYESIFGRPGAPQQPGMPPPYVLQQQQQQPPLPLPQHPLYHYQAYPHPGEKRTSFGSSYAPSTHSHASHASHGPPASFHQRHNPYNHHSQPHVSPQSLYPPPSSVHSRARSVASSSQSPGIIMPQPPEPPDRSLEPFTLQGLTPAQAYQAQFYLNGTAGSQQPSRLRSSHNRPSADVPGPQHLPRLSLTLEHDDNNLGLDFTVPNGTGSDQGTDEGGSELPWARNDDSGTSLSCLILQRSYQRHPQLP